MPLAEPGERGRARTLNAALRTTVVGSYAQPDWLVDRAMLGSRLPPRVRAREVWRIPEPFLQEAQDDATLVALRDMERAGIDIVTDGEIRRESYSNRFATALAGIDLANPGTALDRTGHPNPVPRIVGRIARREPVMVRDVAFLRANTDRPIKITVPGPFTMSQQAQNDFYPDLADAALDFAAAVNEELRDLRAAGADVVQIDEPYLQARPQEAARYALPAIERALAGIDGVTVLHTCFGYAHVVHARPQGYPFLAELDTTPVRQIALESMQQQVDLRILDLLPNKTVVLGVIDLDDAAPVEEPETVARQIRRALEHVPPERLLLSPDCGMKYLPRATAFAKLQALVEGTKIVRRELGIED
jgi:5-methyltetrahydropteroyltriglutamate--homocysteine methyltransferase